MSCCLSLKSQFLATAFLSYAIVLLVVCERILLIFRPLMIASCRMIRCDVIFAGEGGVHRGGPHAEGRRGEKASRYIYIYTRYVFWCRRPLLGVHIICTFIPPKKSEIPPAPRHQLRFAQGGVGYWENGKHRLKALIPPQVWPECFFFKVVSPSDCQKREDLKPEYRYVFFLVLVT